MLKNRYAQVTTLIAALAVTLAAAGCGSGDSSSKVGLAAYSTPQGAYEKIIPAFKKTADGKGVSFTQSFGASGDQARAVEAGLKADVVALSLAPDVNKLVKAGKVDADWTSQVHGGFVTNSIVVFVTRKGNPMNFKNWSDLIRPGVEVITPNPFTSGGARWNIMAAYGSQREQGKDDAGALDYIRQLFKNVPVQDKSARESLQTFAAGKGDVLLAYENEAITAQLKGQEIDFTIPDQTILIENPAALTIAGASKPAAKAFRAFLISDEAQKLFAGEGYRPVVESLVDTAKFPTPSGLFKIDKFGGWSKVTGEFFDPEKGKIAEIEKNLGVSTEK